MIHRQEVDVICLHKTDGSIRPISILWDGCTQYKIRKINQCIPCASLKGGGAGIRYTCIFENNQARYLFLDNHTWFIENL